jgi:hypothetical protein
MAGVYMCPSVARTCLIRATRNDACGVPIPAATAKSRVMFSCFAEINLSPVIEDSGAVMAKDACGRICVYDPSCPQLTHLEGTLKLAGKWVQPFMEMAVRTRALLGDESQTAGTTTDIYGGALASLETEHCDDSLTLEFWAKNSARGSCSIASSTGSLKYVQFALPKAQNWRLTGGLVFNGQATQLEFKFDAVKNPNWTPPVTAEWASVDAITEVFAWRAKNTLPTSNVADTNDGHCLFES